MSNLIYLSNVFIVKFMVNGNSKSLNFKSIIHYYKIHVDIIFLIMKKLPI